MNTISVENSVNIMYSGLGMTTHQQVSQGDEAARPADVLNEDGILHGLGADTEDLNSQHDSSLDEDTNVFTDDDEEEEEEEGSEESDID